MPVHTQQVGITVDATRAITKLERLKAGFAVRTILDAIGQAHLFWIGHNLAAAGSVPDGKPWQVMAQITIMRRPKRGSSRHFSSPYQQILQQSMVREVNEGGSSVNVGTNARYALFHHEGAKKNGTNWVLPARRLLPEAPVARKIAADTVQAIVDQLVRSNP